jgi:hypothetical protein
MRGTQRARARSFPCIIAAAGLAACAFDRPPEVEHATAELATVTLIATDHEFEAPDRMPALVQVRMENRGSEIHHAQLIQLRDGRTLDDLFAVMAKLDTPEFEMPDFVTWAGGPTVTAPGEATTVTLRLRPGTYYWLCVIPSADDGAPHVAKGMLHEVVVEPAEGTLPETALGVMLTDYDFQFTGAPTAGQHTIRVMNHAAQPHEIVVFRYLPGRSRADVTAWIEAHMRGEPPVMPVGGIQALGESMSANFDVTFEPGDYVAICFIPDAADGAPHLVHGMIHDFTVTS